MSEPVMMAHRSESSSSNVPIAASIARAVAPSNAATRWTVDAEDDEVLADSLSEDDVEVDTEPSVHGVGLAGDPARRRGREERDHRSDVARLAEPADRVVAQHLLRELLVLDHAPHRRRVRGRDGHAVRGDLVSAEALRERPHEPGRAAFAAEYASSPGSPRGLRR